MRFSLALASLFLGTVVASERRSLFSGGQRILGDKGEAVPGDNPLVYCKPEHDTDLLVLDYVNLDPNPPLAGGVLIIEAVGTVLEDIAKGAYVNLQVKYGLIKLLTTTADLCEQVSNVDLECPIKKGALSLTKEVELPQQIPPGTYTVSGDAYTVDDKHIVCFEATVKFS